jgi:hypothetical protein
MKILWEGVYNGIKHRIFLDQKSNLNRYKHAKDHNLIIERFDDSDEEWYEYTEIEHDFELLSYVFLQLNEVKSK